MTPRRLPYCSVFVEVADTAGLDPIETTINLVPGVLVAGRVAEKESGVPVRGTVTYNPLRSNTNLEVLGHRPGDPCSTALIKPDGTFQIAVLPGPGVLGVRASGNENDDKYASALITKDEMLDKLGEAVTSACYRADDHLRIARDKNTYSVIRQERYQALALLDPEPEAHPLSVDLTCEVGRTIKGTIVGPDGEPIVGATAGGIDNTASRTAARTLETSTFTIEGLNPRRTRSLFFYHAEKGLGTAFEITGDHQGPLTVHLKPFGSVAGRWIDQNGEPFADQTVIAKYGPIRRMGVTDAKGNFQLDGLVPGMNYWMLVPGRSPFIQFEFKVKPGETTDVGTKTIVVQ